MASDAELWNTVSHQVHEAIGYEETSRLVLFTKDLDRASSMSSSQQPAKAQ
jgi:hypothetical protein